MRSGSAHDKLRCIFSAMETLVGQFYAASPEYPAWADKEWVDSLKQDYTKYLLTISVRRVRGSCRTRSP